MIAIRMEPEEVDAVTHEFFRFLTERKDVDLTIRERADKEEELTDLFDEFLPHVKAQIGELIQVWTNLIDNALDAMEPNGKGTLTIKTERDKEFVQVTIADDGPGIPEEIRSRIFDPFFAPKEMGKGTG